MFAGNYQINKEPGTEWYSAQSPDEHTQILPILPNCNFRNTWYPLISFTQFPTPLELCPTCFGFGSSPFCFFSFS